MRFRRDVFIFVLFLLGVWLSKGQAASLEKLKFPYSPIAASSLPWWIAKEAGLFEKHGIDADILFAGASSVMVQAMLSGEANLAGMGGPAVIANVLKGGDIIQVAAIVKTFTTPMFVQPSITQLAQLSGQKIAVSRYGSVSHLTAQTILQRAGVTGATIIQSGGVPESAAALSTGNVAAAMVQPPQSARLKEKGFRELVTLQDLIKMNVRFVENGIAARRPYAEKNPDIIKRFIRAVYEGMRQIHDRKDFAIKIIAKYTKVTDEKLLDESYNYVKGAFAKEPSVPRDGIEMMVEQMVSLKTIDAAEAKKTPVTAYYENRYVNELEKEGFFKKLWE
jgi:ABC-type nitrate/sulfonate/bicarbonate transport system substrate-binding protein